VTSDHGAGFCHSDEVSGISVRDSDCSNGGSGGASGSSITCSSSHSSRPS